MKFDAWPVEPPGFGSGPLSIRMRSFQPRWARWPTRQLPTMPAPMTTAHAVAGRELATPDSSATGISSGSRLARKLIYHTHALVARAQQLVLRDRGRGRRGPARGAVRGVRRAGPAG